jgi:hypothetical protein
MAAEPGQAAVGSTFPEFWSEFLRCSLLLSVNRFVNFGSISAPLTVGRCDTGIFAVTR